MLSYETLSLTDLYVVHSVYGKEKGNMILATKPLVKTASLLGNIVFMEKMCFMCIVLI